MTIIFRGCAHIPLPLAGRGTRRRCTNARQLRCSGAPHNSEAGARSKLCRENPIDNLAERTSERQLAFLRIRQCDVQSCVPVHTDIFQRIRVAYLTYCEGKISALQHELRIERELEPDADLESLEAAANELAAQIAKAKTERLIRRGRG